MAGYAEQLRAAKTAHLAATALEETVRRQIAEAYTSWDMGDLTAITVRYKLEAIIRTAYRTSAAVAAAHAANMADIPGWYPTDSVFLTTYLKELLKDVRRNLREYKTSSRDETSRRRAVLRTQHSAGVGAQRGYTDALIASYVQLEDFGYNLRKFWLANFENNVPCEHCRALHGTEVKLRESFKVQSDSKLKIYQDLQGPPRHPQCKCYLAILVVTLENAMEDVDIEDPTPAPESMSTDDVKKLPNKIFDAIVNALGKIIKFVRGR